MLKISEGEAVNGTVTLRLEGRVVGPWVGELRQICEVLLSDGGRLALDLAEVSFADESGVAVFTSLQRRDVKLLNTTPFLAEQMKSALGDAVGSR